MKKLFASLAKRESGVTMVETAMLLPWLFIFLFGITELTLYLYSSNVVHYAAFMAARSYVVHGDKTVSDIKYPYGSASFKSKTVSEATAEKIIFESLPWEHKRINSPNDSSLIGRSYFDAPDDIGAVKLTMESIDGKAQAKLIYCLPIHFNLYKFFIPSNYTGPCSNVTSSDRSGIYTGIPITHKVEVLKNL